MKKLSAMMLVLIMALSLTTVAWATEESDGAAATVVAQIRENEYTDITQAVDAWKNSGGELKLLANTSVTKQIRLDKSATLDLNGCTLTVSAANAIQLDGTATTLNIKDGSESSSGKITTEKTSYIIKVNSGNTLNISGGTLESTATRGAGVHIQGTMNMTGGTIVGDTALRVYNGSATASLTISGGKIKGNLKIDKNGSATITGGDFSEVSVSFGNQNSGTLTVSNSVAIQNIDTTVKGYHVIKMTSENGDVVYSLAEGLDPAKAEAKINNSYYATLSKAVEDAQPNDTIVLLKNADFSGEYNKTLTIDLNGKKLTNTIATAPITISENMSICDNSAGEKGSVETAINYIHVKPGAALTIGAGVTVTGNSATNPTIFVGDTKVADSAGAALHIYGTVKNTGGGTAISGNGTDKTGTTINIYDGAEITANNVAIYHPQCGNLNVYSGTIIGTTAIYMKSGHLNICGGNITSNGDKAEYQYQGSGCIETGDAVVIDTCGYPGGNPTVSITGGAFTSVHAQTVGNYAGNSVAENSKPKDFIAGGTFSDNPTVYVKDKTVLQHSRGGDTRYAVGETAKTVARGAEKGDTITVLKLEEESIQVPYGVMVINGTDGNIKVNNKPVNAGENYTPKRPSTTDDTVESADTFDTGVALYGAMALSSALGAAYVSRKKCR